MRSRPDAGFARRWRKLGSALLALAAAGACAAPPAAADPIADFYRGRTVSLLIGVNVGGSYDRDARLVARYLGSFDETMKDPRFLHDVEVSRTELGPITGEALQRSVARILATPKPWVERARGVLQ
jgi:hypothetical protein